MRETALRFEGVAFSYRRTPVFAGFDLAIDAGSMTALLGPNGSGKTTFVRLASAALRPSSGRITLLDHDLAQLASRERARRVAVVPQETHPVFDFTVFEYVLMGRAPHLGFLGIETEKDREIAEEALERADVAHLARRTFRALSGGERQRVLVARALAQRASLLLLDEPTAFLDLKHRLALYDLLARLNDDESITVVVVSHDVNLAARYCERLVLLREGAIAADGEPRDVLRPGPLRDVYGVEVEIRVEPTTGRPFVVPLRPSASPLDSPSTAG